MRHFIRSLFLLVFVAAAVSAAPVVITNNAVWRDTSGNEILAQGGSILQVGNTFYWYGYDLANNDVRCYSSTDLKNWSFVRISYNGSGWYGRPKVLYNRSTGKYVMITEAPNTSGTGRNWLEFFSASSPTSAFTPQRTNSTVLGFPMGDHGVFQDTDGTAYLLATTDENGVTNGSFKIVRLTPDYLNLDAIVMSWITASDKREAASILKLGSTYYLFTSGCLGWSSTATKYWKSTSLSSGWSALTVVGTSPASTDSFNTQHNMEIVVNGTLGTTYIYGGDRWSQKTGVGVGKNAWYPLTFDGSGNPTLYGCGQWSLDVLTGLWSTNGAPKTTPVQLSASLRTDQVQFSWPADHIGWQLQAQTNALTRGLGTNWSGVAGSASTNQVFVPIVPTNGSVFFRLAYP